MIYVPKEEWKPQNQITLDVNSLKIVKSNSNTLVAAGPGAGKTELLAQKAAYLLQTNSLVYPRRILALSYKVDAAKNLDERVKIRCGEQLSGRFNSRTYDAFARRILDQFINLLPEDLKPAKNYGIAKESDIKAAYLKAGHRKTFFESRNFYLRTYLGEYKLPHNDNDYGSIARDVWPILLKGRDELQPKLTYKMIARLAEHIISRNINVRKSLQITYGHIFLDEFQDTPLHHYDLIKTAFLGSSSIITAVGDSKQRVMIWAGAIKNVFEQFTLEFGSGTETLLVNHRSAPKLLMIQQPIVKLMTGQEIAITPNERWQGDEGASEIWGFLNEQDETVIVSQKISEMILINHIEPKDICILTRKLPARYSEHLIAKLSELGIESRIEENYQSLLKEDLIKILLSVFSLVNNKKAPRDWQLLIDILKQLNGYTSRTPIQLLLDVDNRLSVYLFSVKNELELISTESELFAVIDKVLNFFDSAKLIGFYKQYNYEYIEALKHDFVKLLWNEFKLCNDWSISINRLKGEQSIPIMSIHKSKGLEYKAVFLLGLEDDAFFGDDIDEELCTFFVAVSRAIEHFYMTRCKYRFNDTQTFVKVYPFFDSWRTSGIGKIVSFTSNFNEEKKKYFGE
ncbi:UvrD-helicase domain-containing protein [Paenibacillus sp. FSL H8-0259]|uniref:UvrD-helicase domain-containing protein n=1 Tax=Paenibacillus sp. FSL H8-0259 TaxID=1920423 RepID=UPI00096FA7B8|nr:ATP-dependent helicase [Paenibacillus sp. FSL H8-0259]OMF24594.1 hypothetical protein BK132_23315 [Paenibacillus sp. FSL H8-0259]